MADAPKKGAEDGGRDPIAELLEGDFDISEEGEALGELLGAPPPLPPPPDEDLLSSAPRPTPTSPSPRPTPASLPVPVLAGVGPEPPPTDDEIFGDDLEAEVEAVFDEASAGSGAVAEPTPGDATTEEASGPADVEPEPSRPGGRRPITATGSEPSPAPAGSARTTAGDDFDESTRLASIDDSLLRQIAAPVLGAAPATRPPPTRRGPAVVRRDQLPPRSARPTAPPFEERDATRIADFAVFARDVPDDEPPAAAPAPVDLEGFYDDIEIAAADEAAPTPTPTERSGPVARRVSQNVVRRAAVAPAGSAAPSPRSPFAQRPRTPTPTPVAPGDATAQPVGPAAGAVGPEETQEAGEAARDGEVPTAADLAEGSRPVVPEIEVTAPSAVEHAPVELALAEQPPGEPLLAEPASDEPAHAAPAPTFDEDLVDAAFARATESPAPADDARVAEPPAEPSLLAEPPAEPAASSLADESPASSPTDVAPPEVLAPQHDLDTAVEHVAPEGDAAAPLDAPRVPAPAGSSSAASLGELAVGLARVELPLDPQTFTLPELGAAAREPDDERWGTLELLERELAAAPSGNRALRLRLAAGILAEELGDLSRARAHLEEATDADPQALPPLRALRRVLMSLGEHEAALTTLSRELEGVAPEERPLLAAHYADLLVALGEAARARELLAAASAERPDDARPLLARLELAWVEGDTAEIVPLLAAAAGTTDDAPLAATLSVLRGRVLERVGDLDDAERAYRDALTARSGDRLALLGLARLALRRGRELDAARHAAELLAGSTDEALVRVVARRRAGVLLAAGETRAAADVAAAAPAGDDPLVLERRAETSLADGRDAAAAAALAAWVEVEPVPSRRAQALRQLAALREVTTGLSDAAATLQAAIAVDPDDRATRADLEDVLVTAGDVDGAVDLLRLEARDPERATPARLRAARLLGAAGRPDEAIAELEAARVEAPGEPAVVAELARRYAAAGRLTDRARLLLETVALDWREPLAARERAARAAEDASRAAGGAPEAVALAALEVADHAWRAVRAADPAAVTPHVAVERLAHHRGDRDVLVEALAAQQDAARDPARAAALGVRRAGLLLVGEHRQPTAARAALEQAHVRDPDDPRPVALLAALALEEGRLRDAALVELDRAERLPSGAERDALRYRAALALASLPADERDPARAIELLLPLVAERPGFAEAGILVERACRELGDVGALLAQLERDARGGEGSPLRRARLVRLAEAIAFVAADPRRGLAPAREALAIDPDDLLVRDALDGIAAAAGELAPLAELALADRKHAEELDDHAGKLAALERLAELDEQASDPAAGTLAWEAVANLDPTRMTALRALERAYLAEGRDADLAATYTQLSVALASSSTDVVPIVLERARQHERVGDVLETYGSYREALRLAPRTCMALFRLEARAREEGALEELALFDEEIANYFEADPRARAAFLTRAAEAWTDLGRHDEAIARFRAAVDALPDFVPALRGWRRVALAGERWADVVDVAEREAQAARTAAERRRLFHLAGVTAMDRAGDPERAIAALREALALDPRDEDSFQRLRRLYASLGRTAELAALLSARVDIETDALRLLEHHQTLARLYREALRDDERAKAHLRAVLTIDRASLSALTSLSEIAWEQGHWSEAASALITRAKLERDQAVLRGIFFRLGVIYADKLPDVRWALKSFERVLSFDANDLPALEYVAQLSMEAGDWRVALAAAERLVALVPDTAERIRHLHRAAQIHDEGFRDRKRAEEALRRALDVDPYSPSALGALIGFFQRAGDATALRVHLDRVIQTMRGQLQRDAFDGAAYRVLARALSARDQAGVAGSRAAARCAAEVARALGTAGREELALIDEEPPSARGLGGWQIDEALFHPTIPNGFRQIFRLMSDVLARRYPADLKRHGVGRGDRLPRGSHPVREVVGAVAGELGVREFDVYVCRGQPHLLAVEPTDPVALVLGTDVVAAGHAALRFAVARLLKLHLSQMAVPARVHPEEMGVLLGAVIRQYDTGFVPTGVGLGSVAEEAQRLARVIPKRLRDELLPFAGELSGHAYDHQALWLGVQHTGNRAGLLAAGSVQAGLDLLLRAGGYPNLPSADGDAPIEELLRFSVSEDHVELRALLRTLG